VTWLRHIGLYGQYLDAFGINTVPPWG